MNSDRYEKNLAASGFGGTISTLSCARICTSTMSAGTRGSRTAAGADLPEGALRIRRPRTGSLDQAPQRTTQQPVHWMTDSVLPIVAANRVDIVKSAHTFNDLVTMISDPRPHHRPLSCAGLADPAPTPSSPATYPLAAASPTSRTRHDGGLRLRAGRTVAARVARSLMPDTPTTLLHGALSIAVDRPRGTLARRIRNRREVVCLRARRDARGS